MKKILFVALALLGMSTARAQYFHSVFGTTTAETARKGSVGATTGNDNLHFQTGSTPVAAGTPVIEDCFVVSADKDGRVGGAGTFAKRYRLSYSGSPVSAIGVQVRQLAAGGNIAVMGNYYRNATGYPTVYGIFYMRLSSAGVPQVTKCYKLGTQSRMMGMHSMKIAANGDLIACGYADISGSPEYGPMLLRINPNSGAIVWSKVYKIWNASGDDDYATDFVESTDTPSGNAELAVVGYSEDGSFADGFFFRVSGANGGLITFTAQIYSGPNGTGLDRLYSIIDSDNSFGGNSGYVVGGETDDLGASAGVFDYWAMKINNTGTTIDWSEEYDYTNGGHNYGRDIIERQNTSADYEYYFVGWAEDGSVGGSDMVVVKADDAGIPVASGEFTYGGTGNDFGYAIDISSGTTSDGLAMFGQRPFYSGTNDFYMVKSYFNGVSCAYALDTPPDTDNVPDNVIADVSDPTSLLTDTMITLKTADWNDSALCTQTTVTGGDNSRKPVPLLSEAPVQWQMHVYPQPAGAQSNLNVVLQLPKAGLVNITLSDMTGRNVLVKRFTANEGTTLLELETAGLLSGGMYVLRVDDGTNAETKKVLVH